MRSLNKLLNQLFLIFGILETTFAVQLNTVLGCSFDTSLASLTPGFQAAIYHYPCDIAMKPTPYVCANFAANEATLGSEFYASGYLSSFITSTNGVTSPQFSFPGGSYDFDMFGMEVSGNNYTLELSGYFYPQKSGIYSIEMTYFDNGLMLWFGSGAVNCCQQTFDSSTSLDENLYFSQQNGATTNANVYVYLEMGYYYPVRIVTINASGPGALNFQFVDPDGDIITDFDTVYSHGDIGSNCASELVTQNTVTSINYVCLQSTYTAYTTYSVSTYNDGGVRTLTEVITQAPGTCSFATITTGSISTEYPSIIITTDSNGNEISSTEIITLVPTKPFSTVVITSGSITSEYTSIIATTDSNGNEISSTEIITLVPTKPFSTVVITSGTIASEYSSVIITTDSDGNEISSTEIITLVPTKPFSTVVITSGSITSEYTSIIATTDSNGNEISSTEIITLVPTKPFSTVVITSGTIASEYSSVIITTDSNGNEISSTEIITLVPTKPFRTVVTTTGSVTTDIISSFTTVNSIGDTITTAEVVLVVPTGKTLAYSNSTVSQSFQFSSTFKGASSLTSTSDDASSRITLMTESAESSTKSVESSTTTKYVVSTVVTTITSCSLFSDYRGNIISTAYTFVVTSTCTTVVDNGGGIGFSTEEDANPTIDDISVPIKTHAIEGLSSTDAHVTEAVSISTKTSAQTKETSRINSSNENTISEKYLSSTKTTLDYYSGIASESSNPGSSLYSLDVYDAGAGLATVSWCLYGLIALGF